MATNYSSMTVVQIRELFKSRGIPTTGLTKKQQLIDRLVEEDGKAAETVDVSQGVEETQADAEDQVDGTKDATEHVEEAQEETVEDQVADTKSGAEEEQQQPYEPTQGQQAVETSESPVPAEGNKPSIAEKDFANSAAQASPTPMKDTQDAASEEQPPTDSSVLPTSNTQTPVEAQVETAKGPPSESPREAGSDSLDPSAPALEQETTRHNEQDGELSRKQTSEPTSPGRSASQLSDGSIPIEESRKRKRRSASPPPSEVEVAQKKAKQEADGERVILQEDSAPLDIAAPEPGRKFKELMSPQGQQSNPMETQAGLHSSGEREVEPAIHTATCALYIRNLKRPLRPDAVKAHLELLAKPSQVEQSGTVVKDFFLDAIRTHCFVVFDSLAAASRVRSALHGLVWPPEGIRDPLWVDFVPEEKVVQWIRTETAAGSGGRGGSTNRWEIQYDRLDDGSVTTSLQNLSGGPVAPRRPAAASTDTGSRSHAAVPSVPRPQVRRESSTRKEKTEQQRPASFLTLDALFKSTQAKPKLYFMPVSKDVAEQRLTELDRLSTRSRQIPPGGSGYPDSRRYTFEGGALVDNGPEFGLTRSRRRPPRGQQRFRGGRR